MKMTSDHTEERLMGSRSRQVVRSFGLFLPKSLRAKLSSAASGVIWLLGRHGLRLELTQLKQQSATLRVRVAELEGSLAQSGAELQKTRASYDNLDSRLFARLAGLDSHLLERDGALRDGLTAKIDELGKLSERLAAEQTERIASIEVRLAERDAVQEAEFRKILDYHDLLNAHLALVRRPDDILLARQLISKFHLLDKNLPDDIQEQMLRLELHERPYDEKLPYALVAVLYGKLGRAPLPDPSLSPAKFVPAGDPRSLDDLVKSAEAHARTGDPFAVYAALWQAIVGYPDTSRGWAEFARHLALRGAWSYCRTAASHALNNAKTIDAATVASLSAALSILADEGQLADLDWQNWVQKLTPTQRMRAPIVNLLLRSGDVEAASTLLPQVIKNG